MLKLRKTSTATYRFSPLAHYYQNKKGAPLVRHPFDHLLTARILTERTTAAESYFLFDVVDNRVQVLVATRVDSGNGK
jgi:hypothetical protein